MTGAAGRTLYSQFWAKTADKECRGYKPVGHHLLDVAAVAGRYLAKNPARLERERRLSGLSGPEHVRLCAALAGLHDLGKISRPFQSQAPAFWPAALSGSCPSQDRRLSHWEATAVLLQDREIERLLKASLPTFVIDNQIVAAVAGHHGVAPDGNLLGATGEITLLRPVIGEDCIGIARSLVAELLPLLAPNALEDGDTCHAEAFSFSLNGLITLADWVGSDVDAFPFEEPEMSLEAYHPLALERADRALSAKGLVPMKHPLSVRLSDLSPRAGGSPRPMQRLADGLHFDATPQMVVIEDGTGSGKTEAALLIAARMMAAGLGEGVYVALPTMATANAMHGRLENAIRGLFDESGERMASLVLAHGRSRLARELDALSARHDGGQGREESVASRFNAWIGDSRKTAFFADAGAGTIDQAFLSILPKKHLTLRQYALAGRILVIDEAHACDAYMGEELNTLVRQQARLGGSVIILSATLGRRQRRELITAFASGRGVRQRRMQALFAAPLSEAYPLLTRYAGGEIEEHASDTAPGLARSVVIRRLGDRKEALAEALAAAGRGAAVAMVCNAVDSAIAMHRALIDAGHPPHRLTLFHARFAMGDRMATEEKVLRLFGPDSGSGDRIGQILVATQVVEQSLDLDFDLMISDLAPVDLLIQRAGRLWRHRREGRPLAEPVMGVISPDPADATEIDWLGEVLGPAAYTYRLPGVVWRSARDLFQNGRLETPGDLRPLIEAAYRLEPDDLPQALAAAHDASLGNDYAAVTIARNNTIDPGRGYGDVRRVSLDEEIGTRLGEETVTVRLARRSGGLLVPAVRRDGAGVGLDWALSELSVRKRWLLAGAAILDGGGLPAPRDPAARDAARGLWPEWERTIALYEVDSDGSLATAQDMGLFYDGVGGLRRQSVSGA
ncbi:CRISPR-associated helicase Cas3' [Rhizobium daejeonense]|uniref:CRISPR-associated helicase Cas3 n=1 Tax=Rhizobium daejeonense TaxID=240521 RepID=A0A6M1S7Q0_9HYPH|nr:CRISPR-associated helicase Cas3' [Rhizobium daejeonense]NGO62706.1 CRISPR-associated helicase Cas3' [Rhizobium daejeonense]